MELFSEIFGRTKPIIGMAHFPPLPGSPGYDRSKGIRGIVESVRRDILALQEGGVDGVLFANEGDLPYVTIVGPEVPAVMAAVIGELKRDLRVPYGVDILWDPKATLALAVATGASFVREVFTGLWAGDLGLWNTSAGETLRYRSMIGAEHVKLFFNINAEFTGNLDGRSIEMVARSVVFSSKPDALCISGALTGQAVDLSDLKRVKETVGDVPVIANTGVTADTVGTILKIADAAIVGTSLKVDGRTFNPVDVQRVRQLIKLADEVRGEAST